MSKRAEGMTESRRRKRSQNNKTKRKKQQEKAAVNTKSGKQERKAREKKAKEKKVQERKAQEMKVQEKKAQEMKAQESRVNETVQPVEASRPKEHRRYRGYDVEELAQKYNKREGGWFWKVLFISLGLSAMIIAAAVVVVIGFGKKQTDYISGINASNSLDSLLDGQTNLQITTTYANTMEGSDYKAIRLVRENKDGEYFSYYKTEGLANDYKEVISKGEVYRNDQTTENGGKGYTYYYAMIGNEYNDKLQEISDDLFTVYDGEKIQDQVEAGDDVTITTNYEVQSGDKYTKLYGYSAGEKIKREIIMDKVTNLVTSEKESHNDEVIYTYSLELNVENKTPNFYGRVKRAKSNRKCSVIFDYQGDNEQSYSFDVPTDVYFTMFDHEGYKVYMDKDKQKEFTEIEKQSQNTENILNLYMVKE